MKSIFYFLSFTLIFLLAQDAEAQQAAWPRTVTLSDNSQVKVYEPQAESFTDNLLKIRSAISYLESGKSEPVFGVLWADVTTSMDNQNVSWQSFSVTNLKLPADKASKALDDIENQIQEQAGNWNISISKTALDAKLQQFSNESGQAQKLATAPPSIIYSNKPAILVFVDGEPQIQQNEEWGVNQVVNTPFTILKNNDQQFYLYGNKHWYRASAIKGPWNAISSLPSSLSKADQSIRQTDTTTSSSNSISRIIVSQVPAELVQSDGEANFAPLQGTSLLYMTNSSNDVFMDVNSQHYYVLISGRWYNAPTLTSKWTYTASDKLPADFAKIPETSPKANVLASVAGTEAAFESVADAQVPQTARVDRASATASVTYDGSPSFESIEGTDLRYGVNSSGEVIQDGRTYYYVENGVWFRSQSANGPWVVSTQRPAGIENIPPRYPVYNLKYVHIYDVSPDYVYMGYTPGYLGNYIYGPTIVYGTGHYYKPWRGRYYYARPTTWGFNMRYSPWIGWSFGYNTWPGWFFSFNTGFGRAYRNYPVCGGWWGPSVYRPPYYRSYPSYYGRTTGYNSYRYTSYSYNNVYRSRRDVVTSDRLYRPSVSDRRNNNGGNSYGYNRQGNTNNGRNPSPSRPSGGYTNGRQSGNDRIENGNRPPNINGGNRPPNANSNNGGNRLPNANSNNGGNRPPNASSNNGGNRVLNNNGNSARPSQENNRGVRPTIERSERTQEMQQPSARPQQQQQPSARPQQEQPTPARQEPIRRQVQAMPRVQESQPIPETRPQQTMPRMQQPQRTPETRPQQTMPRMQESQRTPETHPQQTMPRVQQPQPIPERRPQQTMPERQQPQPSRQESNSGGGQRPVRTYSPARSSEERPSSPNIGRQESGSQGVGRESRRRGS